MKEAMKHWTYRYSKTLMLRAYLLGMCEFRTDYATYFKDYSMSNAYDSGRERAHRMTFSYFNWN